MNEYQLLRSEKYLHDASVQCKDRSFHRSCRLKLTRRWIEQLSDFSINWNKNKTSMRKRSQTIWNVKSHSCLPYSRQRTNQVVFLSGRMVFLRLRSQLQRFTFTNSCYSSGSMFGEVRQRAAAKRSRIVVRENETQIWSGKTRCLWRGWFSWVWNVNSRKK